MSSLTQFYFFEGILVIIMLLVCSINIDGHINVANLTFMQWLCIINIVYSLTPFNVYKNKCYAKVVQKPHREVYM